jgi:hypothetical protein
MPICCMTAHARAPVHRGEVAEDGEVLLHVCGQHQLDDHLAELLKLALGQRGEEVEVRVAHQLEGSSQVVVLQRAAANEQKQKQEQKQEQGSRCQRESCVCKCLKAAARWCFSSGLRQLSKDEQQEQGGRSVRRSVCNTKQEQCMHSICRYEAGVAAASAWHGQHNSQSTMAVLIYPSNMSHHTDMQYSRQACCAPAVVVQHCQAVQAVD